MLMLAFQPLDCPTAHGGDLPLRCLGPEKIGETARNYG
jgi:hypothetical protein